MALQGYLKTRNLNDIIKYENIKYINRAISEKYLLIIFVIKVMSANNTSF